MKLIEQIYGLFTLEDYTPPTNELTSDELEKLRHLLIAPVDILDCTVEGVQEEKSKEGKKLVTIPLED